MAMRTVPGLRACAAIGLLVFAACSDDSPSADDDTPAIDAAVPTDAPTTAESLTVSIGADEVTEWDFGNVAIGGSATVALTVTNTAGDPTGSPTGALSGGDSTAFALDAAASSCSTVTELAPDASCTLVAHFVPTAAGLKNTTLSVSASPGGSVDVQLIGTGVGDSAVLIFDPPLPSFGLVEIGASPTLSVSVTNPGAVDVSIVGTNVGGPGFASVGSTCGGTLAAATTCDVTLRFAPTGIGPVAGTLRVITDAGDATASVAGRGSGRIDVARDGVGAGSVTSSPAGIDCGTTCTGLFDGPVTLTAAADGLSVFDGWSTACGPSLSCVVNPAATPTSITASFAPDDSVLTLTLQVTGTVPGFVEFDNPATASTVSCAGTCAINVDSGTVINLHAVTPGAFVGWSGGACTGTTPGCEVVVTADVSAVATFDLDEGGVQSLLPSFRTEGVVYDPSGNLIVASTSEVRLLDSLGGTVWSVGLPAPASGAVEFVQGLKTDAAGNVYVLLMASDAPGLGADLSKISSAGVLEWTETISDATNFFGSRLPDALAVSPMNGDVGVLFSAPTPTLRVFDLDGAVRFTVDVPGTASRCLTVDGSGVWHAGTEGPEDEAVTPHLFSATGIPVGSADALPGYYRGYMTIDGTGQIVATTSGHSDVDVTRTGPDGFTFHEDVTSAADSPVGVAVDADGNIIAVRTRDDSVSGMTVRQHSPAGAVLYELIKSVEATPQGNSGVTVINIATDNTGRFAIVGQFWANEMHNWIGVFDPP